MIMQDPKFSLNPVMTIGDQISEAFILKGTTTKAQAWAKSISMLEAVSIRDPERVMRAYPHEMSGGMGQRVMIAMMLMPDPKILIADEPTSALDVSVQRQVLDIMDGLVKERGMGLIFISHDLNLVSEFCDRVLIMYAGRIVEICEANKLHEAKHAYTKGLLNSLPRLDRPRKHLDVLTREDIWAKTDSLRSL
jgi:peptide/nickel transport system ATP-binding protein